MLVLARFENSGLDRVNPENYRPPTLIRYRRWWKDLPWLWFVSWTCCRVQDRELFRGRRPHNLNCGDCNPKSTYVGHSESFECLCVKIGPWVWPGRVPEKKKTRKKSHTRSIFCQNPTSHGGTTGYSIGTKFGRLVGPFDLITHANLSSID